MAQKNPFDQFDGAAQPVPIGQIGPLQPIITDPAKARQTQLDEEKAAQETAKNTFRTMTAEEVAAQGLPAGGVYQVNGLGEVKTIQAAPKSQATENKLVAQTNAQNLLQAAGVVGGVDPVADLIRGSTSGYIERAGAAIPEMFGSSTTGMENIARLETIVADMTLALTGGSLGAGVSNADVAFLKQRVGNLADPTIPADRRLAAWEEVKARLQRVAGEAPASAASPQAATAPTQAQLPQNLPAGSEIPLAVGGEAPMFAPNNIPAEEGQSFKTTRDLEIEAVANQLWRNRASMAEWLEFSRQYDTPLPFSTEAELNDLRQRYSGINILPSGRDPRADMGILDTIGETITGTERSTPEVEALPDWTSMPELGTVSGESALAGLATLTTDPQETAQIIANQFPGVTVRVDDKGNYILRSPTDGREYAIKPGFRGSDIPRAVGAVAAFTPAGRATTLPGSFAAGAATQAAFEGVQASAGGTVDPAEILLAGGGNVVGTALGRGVSKVLPRGGGGGSPSSVIPDAENVIAAGQREGVRVMTSDIAPPRTWAGRWLQQSGEKLPVVGTAGARAEQQQARIGMIEKLADEYAANPATIDDVTADFMKTRGDAIAKYATQKREVFGSLAGAPAPETAASLKTLDDAIASIGDQQTFSGLTRQLRTWRTDLANARSIDDVERLRKAVGDVYDDESLKAVSSQLRSIVDGPDGLYASINRDMGDYIKANGGGQAFTKWKAANEELSGLAGDLENATLRRVLSRGEATPEEAASLLFSKKPSDVAALFGNLSAQGKQRARSVVVAKLIDDAGGIEELSTARFTSALKKAQKTYGVSFPPEDVARFDGMLRLLQATRRAERAADALPTGQQLLPFAALGGAGTLANVIGGWGATAAVGGSSLIGYKVFESAAMRNLLVALSKTRQGSPGEENVLRMIGEAAAKASVPAGATASTSQKPQAPEVK